MKTTDKLIFPNIITTVLLAALLLAPSAALHAAELKLAAVFSDHMVLQCGKAVPVCGGADPGRKITVEFAGQAKAVTADSAGKWQVKLDPMPASAEPRTMVVKSTIGNSQSTIMERKFPPPAARFPPAMKSAAAISSSPLRTRMAACWRRRAI